MFANNSKTNSQYGHGDESPRVKLALFRAIYNDFLAADDIIDE